MKSWPFSLFLSVSFFALVAALFIYIPAKLSCLDSGGVWQGLKFGCEYESYSTYYLASFPAYLLVILLILIIGLASMFNFFQKKLLNN